MVRTAAAFFCVTLGMQGLAMQSPKQIITTGAAPAAPFSPAVKAGGLIYVAGTLASDGGGKLIAGDVRAQTKQVLDNIGATLAQAGSSIDRALSVHVYLKRGSDFSAMNEVYRTYWPKDPPVRTTIEAELVLPDALVEISMVAAPAGGDRQVIHPSGWAASANPYSYGIKSGDTLFLAGLVSRNGKDNSIVSGDITSRRARSWKMRVRFLAPQA